MIRAIAKGWRYVAAAIVIIWLLADRTARDAVILAAAVVAVAVVMWGTAVIVRHRHPIERPEDEEQP